MNALKGERTTENIYIWDGGSLVSNVGGLGPPACVSIVLCECMRNAPAVSLFLPAFHDTVSLGSPLRQVVYPINYMVPPWLTTSRFLAGNRVAELKPTIFSSLLHFRVFLSFLLIPQRVLCWG